MILLCIIHFHDYIFNEDLLLLKKQESEIYFMYKTIRYSKMENILSCLLRDYHKDINSGSFCDDLYKFNNIFMSII